MMFLSSVRHYARFASSSHRLPTLGLALAILATAALPATSAIAQSTSAHIFGQGPAGARVEARSDTGARRTTTIRDDGRYDLRALPMGVYTVTLTSAGVVADTRKNIQLTVGRGAEVDFACPHDQCGAGTAKSP
ncbi:MAG: carboxypeptidase-like regulatory domain-containing protein [Pseudomonadota bacterium]